jgi:uncharacterized damage-inducible protein DinB
MTTSHRPDASVLLGIGVIAATFRMNTRLFVNCLDRVAEEKATHRPNDRTNSMSFIACHLVDSRHFLTRFLGFTETNPLEAVLREANSIDDIGDLPSLEAIRNAWRPIARSLDACLLSLSEEELTAPSTQRFPVDDPTVFGAIGFLLQHESYHIGQMALLRKFLGYPAMKYG